MARDPLSEAFAALADPTRRDILTRLRTGPLTATDLAANYPMSRPAVSQHLTVLERADLISRTRRAQWHDFSLSPAGLDDVTVWLEQQRAEWTERFDQLEVHLRRHRSKGHG